MTRAEQALGCDDRLVRRWASGDAAVPPDVTAWLELLGAVHAQHPPPGNGAAAAAQCPPR